MTRRVAMAFVVLAVVLNVPASVSAQLDPKAVLFTKPEDIKFVKNAAGTQETAVLFGDPAKEGPFTMRILMPDGYKIPPHIHPKTERVTVISGTFNFGMGDKFDQAATQELPAGAFGFWPAGMTHFAWAKGETVVQVHGVGPWGIEYVNPADDPRKK